MLSACATHTDNTSEVEIVKFESPLTTFYSLPIGASSVTHLGGTEVVPINCIVVTCNNDLLIADAISNLGIFRFSDNGNFKNKVGGYGRGPGEFTNISSLQIENNEVNVFSSINKQKLVYSLDGKYLSSKPIHYTFSAASDVGENKWIYLGHGNPEHHDRLIETDADGNIVSKWLSENRMLLPFDEATPVFSGWNGNILFRETFNNSVYEINENRLTTKYTFDLLQYNLPEEMFKFDDPYQQFDMFLSKPTAIIKRVNENEEYVVVEFFVNSADPKQIAFFYAIKNKGTKEWTWIKISDVDDPFFGSYRYLTEKSELLFILEPHKLSELDVTKLNGVSEDDISGNENDNNSILKIRLN